MESLKETTERTARFPRSAVVLLGLNLLQALAFVAFRNTNVTFWSESLDKSEKYGFDANFAYGFLIHFTPIITGFLADNYFGRYSMTLAHIVLLFIGFGCMIIAASVSLVFFAWVGLTIIATAVGINKAVVPTFNADQFTPVHPKEAKNLIFAWYFTFVNIGAVVSSYFIASQKDLFQCFNRPCYPMMYGTCVFCISLSGVVFLLYRKNFIRAPLKPNVVVESIKCVFSALFHLSDEGEEKTQIEGGPALLSEQGEYRADVSSEILSNGVSRFKEVEIVPTGTFLDRAYPKYDRKFIADILQVARVGKLFCIGIPYFTCYNVVYGPWASQFSRTDGQIGPITVNFLAYLTSNPFVCVIFIIALNKLILPVLDKYVKVTLLRKMAAGGIAAVICCCCVIGVQYKLLADDLPPLKTGTKVLFWSEKSLRNCDIFLTDSGGHQHKLNHLEENMDLKPGNYGIHSSCRMSFTSYGVLTKSIELAKGINILALYPGKNSGEAQFYLRRTSYEKVRMIRTQVDVLTCRSGSMSLNGVANPNGLSVKMSSVFWKSVDFILSIGDCSKYNCLEFDVNIKGLLGSKIVYFDEVNCQNQTEPLPPTKRVLVAPHTVHFSWMLPQNIMFALAEALLGVAALEFAYTQTSDSMKSVVQALWLQTAALGSLLGLALNQFGMSLLTSFYVYAVIMLAGTLIFIFFATLYRYVDEKEEDYPLEI